MTTPVWITGFEYGVADPNANGGGLFNFVASPSPNVQIISTEHNTGTYALKLEPDGTQDAYVRKSLSTPSVCVGRHYFKIGTNPVASAILCSLPLTTSSNTPRIYINPSTNVIELRAGVTIIATGPSYSTGVWYCLDWSVDVTTNPWQLKARIDGGTEFSGTSGQAGDTITGYQLGTSSTAAWVSYVDDVVVSVTLADYPIGAGGTEALKPVSDGTHNSGTNIMENQAGTDIGVVTAWDLVDDIPINTATTYIQQLGNGTGNYAEMNFGDIVASHSSIIGAMAILAYSAASTTSNNGGCIVSKDSFSSNTVVHGSPSTPVDYSDGSLASPYYKSVVIDGVVDDTTVNALKTRVGYSADAAPDPYWINIIVEVAYVPSNGTIISLDLVTYTSSVNVINVLEHIPVPLDLVSYTSTLNNVTILEHIPVPLDLVSFTSNINDITTIENIVTQLDLISFSSIINDITTVENTIIQLDLVSFSSVVNTISTIENVVISLDLVPFSSTINDITTIENVITTLDLVVYSIVINDSLFLENGVIGLDLVEFVNSFNNALFIDQETYLLDIVIYTSVLNDINILEHENVSLDLVIYSSLFYDIEVLEDSVTLLDLVSYSLDFFDLSLLENEIIQLDLVFFYNTYPDLISISNDLTLLDYTSISYIFNDAYLIDVTEILVTPFNRCYFVKEESRYFIIEREKRIIKIKGEERIILVK